MASLPICPIEVEMNHLLSRMVKLPVSSKIRLRNYKPLNRALPPTRCSFVQHLSRCNLLAVTFPPPPTPPPPLALFRPVFLLSAGIQRNDVLRDVAAFQKGEKDRCVAASRLEMREYNDRAREKREANADGARGSVEEGRGRWARGKESKRRGGVRERG